MNINVPTIGKGEGSALIVALWVLMILTLLISSFAFDMSVEGGVTSYFRKRNKAQYLARAGIEWTKVMLHKEVTTGTEGDLQIEEGDDEEMVVAAINLARGVGVQGVEKELGEGRFILDILPEEGRRNVNTLSDEDWEEILDQGRVPEDQWPEMIDCFNDWVDEGDEHRLNGAESDDEYYKEAGYKVKNAPVDTIDELLLIKGFDEGILYGKAAESEEDEEEMPGIAGWLTTWGDGRVNVNTASKEVLMTIPGMEEWVVDDIIEKRVGPDGEAGTRDDGFENVDEVVAETGMDPNLKEKITTTERQYLRVVSMGQVHNARSGIWCVLQADGDNVIPVYWREESMP